MLKQKLSKDHPPNEWTTKRVGFEPDVLVRLVGSTMGEKAKFRQRALEKAKAFQGPETAPPVKLIREKDNPVDPGAVKVYIGTDVNLVDGVSKWTYTEVGYLPQGYRIQVRGSDGALRPNPAVAPDGFQVWKVMDALEEKRAQGRLLVGVNFITRAPNTTSFGCELGLRYESTSPIP